MNSLITPSDVFAAGSPGSPTPIVAVLITALAIAVALYRAPPAAHGRATAAPTRVPDLFSVITQMRGLTRLALFILAVFIALPKAPLEPRPSGCSPAS